MKGEEGLQDAMVHEETPDDVQNDNIMEVEEGEIVDVDSQIGVILNIGDDVNSVNQGSCGKNHRSKKKKKKKKRGNKGNSEPNLKDIDRFVSDVCKRLKERKSYMVYMAVGCLGISAIYQLVKEVDAVQACGGQKTSDGRHLRTGGGVLWNLLKSRDPNAYKEIMKRAKEFEKQFRLVRAARKDMSQAPFTDQTEVSRLNMVVPSGSMNKKQNFKVVFPARKDTNHASSSDGTELPRLTRVGISKGLGLECRVRSRSETLDLRKQPLSPIAEENTNSVSDDCWGLESHVRNQLELLNIKNSAREAREGIELPVSCHADLIGDDGGEKERVDRI